MTEYSGVRIRAARSMPACRAPAGPEPAGQAGPVHGQHGLRPRRLGSGLGGDPVGLGLHLRGGDLLGVRRCG